MIAKLSPELFWLAAVSMLTAVLWAPYTLRLILQMGPVAAFWNPYHETPLEAPWAQRAKRAHTNAVENLAIFAPLAIAVHILGLGNPLTAFACTLFFLVRAAHYVTYLLAVPLVRTLLFLVGFGCQSVLGARLFGWL
jgi:uncharacterized MAPEG superfamily protein